MSMLARYRKQGGIMELLKLIEDSPEPKRTTLLDMVRKEDADFAAQVECRILKFESIKTLPESIQAEIFSLTPPKFVALSLTGEPPEYIKFVEKCLGKNFNDYKLEKDNLASTPATPAQVEAARRKLISELRKLEATGNIRIPYPEPGQSLGTAPSSTPAAGKPAGPNGVAAAAGAAVAGSSIPQSTGPAAKESDPAPPTETYQMDPPPPGLSGERFETYLKGVLGK